jgi:rhomboid protease GluP
MAQDPNDDMQEIMRRLEREIGPRREEDEPPMYDERHPFQPPEPAHGEAQPLPQQETRQVQIRIPLSRPRSYRVLLGINIAVYLLSCALSGGLEPTNAVLNLLGEKNNAQIYLDGEYWRFLTAMFLHGGLLHILFNAYALYILGPQTEQVYGTPRFLGLYFIAGFAGGVASYALSPFPSVGASGAIFGLIGGLAAFYYLNRQTLGDMARQQLGGLITVIMLNLFIGFSSSNIDNFAHLGGLFGGIVVGALLTPRYYLDTRLYPPVMERRMASIGWVGAVGVLIIVALAAMIITPPLR